MTLWQKIGSGALLWGCKITGLLPRWFLYGPLRWQIYFVLYRLAGYRLEVVRGNLRNSFPEKDEKELRAIEKEFYGHLAEIFIDTIDMASISRRGILRRITMTGLEEHEADVAGRDWIAAMSHYGTWEYFAAYQMLCPAQVVGAYHPLRDVAFDDFYKRVRSRFGMDVVPSKKLLRYMVESRNAGRRIAVGMIADQNPPWSASSWYRFLNQPTPFYEGIAHLALKFSMPVYFLHIEKKGRARYEGHFERIYDGQEPVTKEQITARYVAMLQDDIRRQPAYWMWSHRRWKRNSQGYHINDLPENM